MCSSGLLLVGVQELIASTGWGGFCRCTGITGVYRLGRLLVGVQELLACAVLDGLLSVCIINNNNDNN